MFFSLDNYSVLLGDRTFKRAEIEYIPLCSVSAENVRFPASHAAGLELHQHVGQSRALLEADQASHVADYSGKALHVANHLRKA